MIYFDSAATTLQKPPSVSQAVADAIRRCASPGRGDYPASRRAEEVMFSCRSAAAELFDAKGPERVVLTQNATHALNIAIRTLVHGGDRVLISAWEHNAVTRTLASIPEVTVDVAQAELFDDGATLRAFEEGLERRPAAVVCTAISNVFGYILPLQEISNLCRSAQVPLIVDGSQAAGCHPLSMQTLDAAFLAAPGHKGLYGPQGTGLLICGELLPEPLLTGGTGSESVHQQMPAFLPDRGEAGTQNVAGVAGLLQGIRFVTQKGVNRIADYEISLRRRLEHNLKEMPGVGLFASESENQSGVISLVCPRIDCQELAEYLGKKGVAVRAGLHCAPLAHQSGHTLESGTVRVSFSAFNRAREVDIFCDLLEQNIHNKLT